MTISGKKSTKEVIEKLYANTSKAHVQSLHDMKETCL